MSLRSELSLEDMLIIAGHLIVDEGDREDFVADSATAVSQARDTDGCLDFAVSADSLDPCRVNVFERWRSRQLLAAFRGSGPDDDLRGRIRKAEISEYAVGQPDISP
jgi:quinol monooxygenase YgiN